jgi:hypothetical protein
MMSMPSMPSIPRLASPRPSPRNSDASPFANPAPIAPAISVPRPRSLFPLSLKLSPQAAPKTAMFDFALASLSVAALLVLWFRTNAFPEYAQAIGLSKLFAVSVWAEARKASAQQKLPVPDYVTFLATRYGWPSAGPKRAFFVRLLTCPFCLGFWLSLAIASGLGHPAWTLAVYFTALFLFKRV